MAGRRRHRRQVSHLVCSGEEKSGQGAQGRRRIPQQLLDHRHGWVPFHPRAAAVHQLMESPPGLHTQRCRRQVSLAMDGKPTVLRRVGIQGVLRWVMRHPEDQGTK
jgi:hypothetical protein